VHLSFFKNKALPPDSPGLISGPASRSRPAQVAVVLAFLLVAFYGLDQGRLFLKSPQSGVFGSFRAGGYTVQKLVDARTSAPLTVGWRITAIDGIPVSRWFRTLLRFPPGEGPSWSFSTQNTLSVTDQQGGVRTILLTLRPFHVSDLGGPFWIWFLAWFILFSGGYLFFRYPVQARVNLLSLLLLAAALSIFNHSGRHLALEMSPRLPLLIFIRLGALSFIFSAWLVLIIIFLNRRGHFRLSSWVPRVIFLAPLTAVTGTTLLVPGEAIAGYERSLRLLHFNAVVVVLFTFAILGHSFIFTRNAVLKAQLKWLLWGHLIGMFPYVFLYSLPIALFQTPLIDYRVALIPLPLIVFSYFFAFYRYRLMDVDRVIEGSLVYGLSAGLLSLGYLAALWLVKERLLAGMGADAWFRSDLLILIGLVFLFNPLKNQVQRVIERTLFPERIALPALLLEESTRISRSSNLNKIAAMLLEDLPAKLSIDRSALLLRRLYGRDWELRQNPDGWLRLGKKSLIELEELEKTGPFKSFWDLMTGEGRPPAPPVLPLLNNRGVAAIFPLKSLDDLWGFYLLGEKRTHHLLNNEEIHVIVSLATQAAHLVGNARLLEGMQKTNRSLGELNNRLLQAEQMANLGEGAAVLAHELKNPLGIIRGSAEILLKGRDPAQQTEVLHFILEETDRLTALVDEFMRFARMAPPEKSPTDLDDLVQSVAFLWETRRKVPSPLAIRFELGLRGETVPLDSRQVYQVLLNLLANAEEAMPTGGRLLLATGLERSSGKAWVSVEDTGKGIPAQDLPRVFDRFFTTRESGLGLGLALVKKVAEAHGGSARIESSEGQGTKVTLFFPR
jgi:signal transduction histidine kinase